MKMRRAGLGLCLLVGLAACSKGPPAGPAAEDGAVSLMGGQALYDKHCAGCHRGDGKGNFLRGVPSVRYTTLSEEALTALIHGHERPENSQMPEFNSLPHAQVALIAGYLLSVLHE